MRVYERFKIIIVVVLGITALGLLTWGIGRVYLDLVGQSIGEKVQGANNLGQGADSVNSTVLILPEAKFWTCQIGVFQSQSNAQLRKEQLNVLNINAEVINANPCLVCIGLSHSADDLKGLKQALMERGISTMVKQIVLPKQTFRVAGNGSQLTAELLTNTNVILRDGFTPQALGKEKEMWDTGATVYPLKNLEGLHRIFNQLRENSKPEEQYAEGLTLYFEYQRVINILSGK
jgi:hypothetical protein